LLTQPLAGQDTAKVNRYFDETGADYYRAGRTTNVNVR
jgi:hypothetical protein